jgi:hypothetical protein
MWYYADTHWKTRHLLGILTSYIKAADFCIFDISLWNPNVALEIGLAEGLGVEYYILLKQSLSKDVPADIQGLQRVQYSETNGNSKDDLVPQLLRYLVKDYTHPRNIYDVLSGDNRDTKFLFAMAVLAHLRDNKRLTYHDLATLGRGTYLRKEAKDDVLSILESLGLITNVVGAGAQLKKSLFPQALKIG